MSLSDRERSEGFHRTLTSAVLSADALSLTATHTLAVNVRKLTHIPLYSPLL
jgi:hypothetical protein